jgi:HlyD family secretion protein
MASSIIRCAFGSSLLLCLLACQAPPPPAPETWSVKPMTLELRVSDTGEITSASERVISAPYSSKINTLLPEGTAIKKGEVLARLATDAEIKERDTASLEMQEAGFDARIAAAEQTQKIYRLARELENTRLSADIENLRLRRLKEERDTLALVQAREALRTLEQEMEIYELEATERARLYTAGYLSKEESEQARLKLEEAKRQREYQQTRLKVLEQGPTREAIAKQQVAVKKITDQLRKNKREVEISKRVGQIGIDGGKVRGKRAGERFKYYSTLIQKAAITAPGPGILIYGRQRVGGEEVKLKAGDTVQEGMTVARLVDLTQPLVRLPLSEVDSARVKIGQKVVVTLDAYPEQRYLGQVQKITPVARKKLEGDANEVRVVDTEIKITNGDQRLRPGMTANVDIITASLPNVLAVPSQAVVHTADQSFCWVLTAEGPQRRPVKTGVSTELETQIVSGLQTGDKVLLQPPLEVPS